ncbi:MAG: peroxiredoxin family protein, partial [Alphaproteobacteria bacterium]|nr:peroxiredoxin family protein [Alphaproteobacteria bacterium]
MADGRPVSQSVPLTPGDPAPWFRVRTNCNPAFHFGVAAGHYIIRHFYGPTAHAAGRAALAQLTARKSDFDQRGAAIFAVSHDPADEALDAAQAIAPGMDFFWDFDRAVATACGVAVTAEPSPQEVLPRTLVFDPTLRLIIDMSCNTDAITHIGTVLDALTVQPDWQTFGDTLVHPPVLMVPRVFEREFCRTLIEGYRRAGGAASGVTRDFNGKTEVVLDHSLKYRHDVFLRDAALQSGVRQRLYRRLLPMIERYFQFRATRIERYFVACYGVAERGNFRPHRDNLARGTEHRRFAVTI